MATYLILNLCFIGAAVIFFAASPARRSWRYLSACLAVVLVLTVVFDSLIIHYGIVAYDTAKLLGAYVGTAPVEDFAYTIAAVLLVPALWERIGKK